MVSLPVNPDGEQFVRLSEEQIWELIDDETFDEDLLCEAYVSEPRPGIERQLRREWPSWPTLVHEIAAARARLTILDQVGLAVREGRRRLGLSQRGLAQQLSLSQTLVRRLEIQAGGVPFGRVVEVMGALGFDLLVAEHEADGPAEPVDPRSWTVADLVVRDSAGRRLPAHVRVARVIGPYRYEGRVDGAPALWTWKRF